MGIWYDYNGASKKVVRSDNGVVTPLMQTRKMVYFVQMCRIPPRITGPTHNAKKIQKDVLTCSLIWYTAPLLLSCVSPRFLPSLFRPFKVFLWWWTFRLLPDGTQLAMLEEKWAKLKAATQRAAVSGMVSWYPLVMVAFMGTSAIDHSGWLIFHCQVWLPEGSACSGLSSPVQASLHQLWRDLEVCAPYFWHIFGPQKSERQRTILPVMSCEEWEFDMPMVTWLTWCPLGHAWIVRLAISITTWPMNDGQEHERNHGQRNPVKMALAL